MKLCGVFSGWIIAALIALPVMMNAQTPVNGYGRVTAIAGSTLTVTNVSETYDTFEDGEFVIIMQVQDDVIGGNTGNSSTFGDVGPIQSAGLYEVAIIASHTEVSLLPNTITLASALTHTYHTGANARVQIISYPTLGSPNYTSPALGISALAWDGNRGGVTAFRVNGILTLGGSIHADGAGFRGGVKNSTNGYTGCDGTTYRTTLGTRYAGKGEGIYLNTTAGYAAGRGKMLNGGGGGNDVNAGGGGGGNYSAGGDGGVGWTPAGTGCSPGVGGLGGVFLSTYISGARLFMGGGGGGGHENDGVGSAGGNGGGLVLIRANSIVTLGVCVNRTISANGVAAANAVNDGSGGGGAGGTVLLEVAAYSITGTCPVVISANGGNGGSSVTSGAHGGGGGGGQGAVIFSGAQPVSNVTTQTTVGIGGSSCIGCTSSQNGSNGSGTNNSGILTGNQNPLPVELVSFTGVQNGSQVDLAWQTATEINNDYFVVEHMDAAGNKKEIGQVDGSGNSSQILNYRLTDFAPEQGVNYYRLRQVDFNGTTDYSEWVAVDFTGANQHVSIMPNPTTGSLQVLFSGYGDQQVTVTITDVSGRTVSEKQMQITGSGPALDFDLSGEPAGIYFLNVISGDQRNVYRVVRY